MLNVRDRDGAAFVMEMGDVKAAVEGAGADGPDLRRALKFRMAIQSDIGIREDRVRLLTRAEAGALASEVQSAAVEDRAVKVAGLQDLYGPLFGRAMKELSEAGLDPRFQVLAVARDNPALARAIAQVIGTEHAELVNGLDGAAVKDLRRRLRDLAPDGGSAAAPGGETAGEIKAVLAVAGDLGLWNLRVTGDVEESAARTAVFINNAIEDVVLTAGEGGAEDVQLDGDPGDDQLAMGAAREAAKAAAAAALREASKIGRMILDRLKGLRAKKGEGQPPGPGVIAVETVANVVRAKLEQRDQARAKAEKEPTLRKLQLVPEDFGPEADAIEVIRAMAEARLVQAIRSNEPEIQLNLENIEDAWAARVKKDTSRLGNAVDVTGLRHAIDTSQITHAFNGHGPGNETDPDNEPISPEAIAAYLEVVKNYDRISGVRVVGGTTRIKFEKRVDGLVVVVEQARTTEKTLAFLTMWIEKK